MLSSSDFVKPCDKNVRPFMLFIAKDFLLFILVPAAIYNHMLSKEYDEITTPFPDFGGCTNYFCEWIANLHYIMDIINYPF